MDYCEILNVLQVTGVVLGVIDLGLTVDSFFKWPDEQFFLAMVIITLILNIALLIGKSIYINETTKILDMTTFLLSGVCLTVAGLVMIVSAFQFTLGISGFRVAERVLAASIGIINGFIYTYIGFVLLRELQNSIHPIIVPKKALKTLASNIVGKLQLAVIVIGGIDLGLTAHSYYRFSEEGFFLAIIVVCFVFSIIELVGSVLGFIKRDEESTSYKTLAVICIIGAVLLFSGGILMIVTVLVRNPKTCGAYCGFSSYDERIFSAIFGIANSFVYGGLAYCYFVKSKVIFDKANQGFDWDYENLPHD